MKAIGTLVTPWSKNDNRVFIVVENTRLYNDDKKWCIVDQVHGERDEYTQYRCLMRSNKLRKLSQEEFDTVYPNLERPVKTEIEGEFPIDSYIMGRDRTYQRSIYQAKGFVTIPELERTGIITKLISFGAFVNKHDRTAVSLDDYEIYHLTDEDRNRLNECIG